MPSGGGTAEIITEVDTAAGDVTHRYVDVLPGNRAVYEVEGSGVPRIQAVDMETLASRNFAPISIFGHSFGTTHRLARFACGHHISRAAESQRR